MAEYNCAACEEIRQKDPNLIVNGFGDTECNYLKNDTGIDGSSNDCTDLGLLNDCLVGNMEDEIDSYDVCDWKDYMKKFVPNVWTVFKAIICAICGIWTNIHNILTRLQKLECEVSYMFRGSTFSFGEYSSDTTSYIVAGKGVSFLNVSSSGTAADIKLTYVAGGLAYLSGSCLFYDSSFQDGAAVYNYDGEGVNPTKSRSRSGNSEWDATDHKPTGGSQLVYELRIKKSEFPEINRFFQGIALNAHAGGYHAIIDRFPEGTYAHGQNGHCDRTSGDPQGSGSDRGHLVPTGWVYLQLRITWIDSMSADSNGTQYTPTGLLGIRMNPAQIDCD